MMKEIFNIKEKYRDYLGIFIGTFLGLGTCSFLSYEFDFPLLIASFGATSVILFGMPGSPVCHPKNVFFGHMISAFIAISCLLLLGDHWYVCPLAVALAIFFMSITKTMHPPGGATALICILQHQNYSFMLFTLAISLIIMMIAGYGVNYILKRPNSFENPFRKNG